VTTIHPGNLRAVMALGDSITAGFNMQDEPIEYRGDVYSAGGNAGSTTIGNFLKIYNSKISGTCTGNTVPMSPGCGLNAAVSGAKVEDIPGQIDRLVRQFNTVPEFMGLKDEWKLLILFIGANNVCGCHNAGNTADQWETKLRNALSYAQQNLGRTFVSVMTLFNISNVWDDAQGDPVCVEKINLYNECGCLNSNASDRSAMDALTVQYNQRTAKVATEFQQKNDANFTVVVQPGLDGCAFGSWGEDFLSDVDCFHPSLCTDQAMAIAIWNNMFQAPANKAHCIDVHNVPAPHCPSANEFIQ